MARNCKIYATRWHIASSLHPALQKFGIYYVDPKPGNVMFGDEAD